MAEENKVAEREPLQVDILESKKMPVGTIAFLGAIATALAFVGPQMIMDKLFKKPILDKTQMATEALFSGLAGAFGFFMLTKTNNEWVDKINNERKIHALEKATLSAKLSQIQQTLGR